MTNIVSAISGQFSKTLILGTFLPVAVFVVLSLILVGPLSPDDWPRLQSLNFSDTQWVLTVSFATILLTGLIYNLNIPIIRFYEGYPWEGSWLGKLMVRRYKAKFAAAQARWCGMRTLAYALHDAGKSEDVINNELIKWGEVVNEDLPDSQALVLPTRLGNVIRCFESYPNRQYSIAAITMWPRLLSKINKDYAAALDDAKTSFDFMLNSSLLSAVLAAMLLAVGLIYPVQFISPLLWIPWAIKIIFFAGASYVFYLSSIGRAGNWGSMVKSAFDLYRWDLLKQLGYAQTPATRAEERDLWLDVSDQIIYGGSPRVRIPDYAPEATYARGKPYYIDLEITRGLSGVPEASLLKINLKVKNVDGGKRPVEDVLVTDRLPEGYEYVWETFVSDREGATISGMNPYKFSVGTLQHNEQVVLSYCALKRDGAAHPSQKPAATGEGEKTALSQLEQAERTVTE